MTVTIRGKGTKIRYVPVMGPTARLVADYLERRDPHPGLGADADPLFHGPNHSSMTRSGVAKLLARHVRAVRARDPDWAPSLPITTHTLRRSRAMHLVQAGVNLIYIRDLLGHADVSTTEIYARADAETKRKAIENAYEPLHPRRHAGLDHGRLPDRLARLARALTPTGRIMRTKSLLARPPPAETPRQGT
jgi:integrase/recombinase XerD